MKFALFMMLFFVGASELLDLTCQRIEVVENSEGESSEERPSKTVDLRTILNTGKRANALPPSVVVRVEADLSHRTSALAEKYADSPKKFKETWEFTSKHVHRVAVDPPKVPGGGLVYRRVESRPFDSKNLCQELLEGKVQAIEAADGTGESVQFVGTNYDAGHRAIEIFVSNQSRLLVCESCFFAGFPKTDARAFAAIYEKLAIQARAAFEKKSVSGKD